MCGYDDKDIIRRSKRAHPIHLSCSICLIRGEQTLNGQLKHASCINSRCTHKDLGWLQCSSHIAHQDKKMSDIKFSAKLPRLMRWAPTNWTSLLSPSAITPSPGTRARPRLARRPRHSFEQSTETVARGGDNRTARIGARRHHCRDDGDDGPP